MLGRARDRLDDLARRQARAANQLVERQRHRLQGAASLLTVLSYENTLERGFTVIRSKKGEVISRLSTVEPGMQARVQFADGEAPATFGGQPSGEKAGKAPKQPQKADKQGKDDPQGQLL